MGKGKLELLLLMHRRQHSAGAVDVLPAAVATLNRHCEFFPQVVAKGVRLFA